MSAKNIPETESLCAEEARTAMKLLLWARDKRIALSELQVGSVRMLVVDLAQMTREPRVPSRDDPDSLYRQYGADAIDRVRKEIEENSTYDDEDEADEGPDDPPAGVRGRAVPGGRGPRRR